MRNRQQEVSLRPPELLSFLTATDFTPESVAGFYIYEPGMDTIRHNLT